MLKITLPMVNSYYAPLSQPPTVSQLETRLPVIKQWHGINVLFSAYLCTTPGVINYSQPMSVTSPRSWSLPLRAQRKLLLSGASTHLCNTPNSTGESSVLKQSRIVFKTPFKAPQSILSLPLLHPLTRGVFRLTRWGWSGEWVRAAMQHFVVYHRVPL